MSAEKPRPVADDFMVVDPFADITAQPAQAGKCPCCGIRDADAFFRWFSKAFCSFACRNRYMHRWLRGKDLHLRIGECFICGQRIALRTHARYPTCSQKCANRLRVIQQVERARRSNKKRHFRKGTNDRSACGKYPHPATLTDNPHEVTCPQCQRTRFYKRRMLRLED